MNKIWLKKCFDVAELLYCVYPYEVLEELYNRGGDGDTLHKDDVIAFLEESGGAADNGSFEHTGSHIAHIEEESGSGETSFIDSTSIDMDYVDATYPEFEALGYHEPGFFRPTLANDDEKYKFYKNLADCGDDLALAHISELDVESILKNQGDTPFYIPTKDEIERIIKTGYNGNAYYDELKKMFKKDPELYIQTIWRGFSSGADLSEALDWIFSVSDIHTITVGKQKALDISMEELNKKAAKVVECYNHTNLREKRGWEPVKLMQALGGSDSLPHTIVPMSEMAAKHTKGAEDYFNSQGINVDYDAGFGSYNTVIDGRLKRVKVGRNDPCPCGSGKKYKKCHGRGESVAVREKEKGDVEPWNTIVAIAQEAEEVAEGVRHDFYFYATKDFTLYFLDEKQSKGNQQSKFQNGEYKPTEKMKGYVVVNEDGPDYVTILNDKLFNLLNGSSGRPYEMEEVQGALAMPGYEEDGIIMVKLRKRES